MNQTPNNFQKLTQKYQNYPQTPQNLNKTSGMNNDNNNMSCNQVNQNLFSRKDVQDSITKPFTPSGNFPNSHFNPNKFSTLPNNLLTTGSQITPKLNFIPPTNNNNSINVGIF